MSTRRTLAAVGLLGALLIAGGVALRVFVFADAEPGAATTSGPVPVELAAIETGALERRRALTGSVEASAQFAVAAKVAGRIEAIHADLGDSVTRGQRLVELDDAELGQAEAAAKADLVVAEAEASAAAKAAKIAKRNLDRVEGLRGRDIASEQELDAARAAEAEAAGAVEVARAQVVRAKAAHRAAQIRRSYAQISADWPASGEPEGTGVGGSRVVAERLVDEGSMVAANAPLLTIVDLDPVVVVVFVTEVDYAALRQGLAVAVTTDAYPGTEFSGEISRIAPVFREQSRQARVEITVANADGRLKPGMFVRAAALLDRVAEATIVPAAALVERDGQTVVFTVEGELARMRAVEVGVRDGERVAVTPTDEGGALTGEVVVLGQQQLVDGSAVVVPQLPGASAGAGGQG